MANIIRAIRSAIQFQFNTASLAGGSHTLQTKAYELQNGTEAVSNVVTFSKGMSRLAFQAPQPD